MDDTEIIKALGCCGEMHECSICPRYDRNNDLCQEDLTADALDLINRQKAEIERLQKHIQEGIDLAKQIPEMVALAQAEAVKQFAERLLELFPSDRVFTTISRSTISRLVKEMVGDNNG